MKWEAHTRTAEKILADFDAYHFKKYEKDLINGIIHPDSNDPKPHSGRDEAIRDYIRKARDRRLDYNSSDSFFYLGMAFHYIQDSWVGMDPDHEDYKTYEKMIDKSIILGRDEDLFRYYPVKRNRVLVQFMNLETRLAKPVKSTAELYELATMPKPYESSAFLDLNFSYRVCYRVAEMVLQPMLKVSLDESLEKLHSEYTEKLVDKEKTEKQSLFEMGNSILMIDGKGTFDGVDRWKKKRTLDKRTNLYAKGGHLERLVQGYTREAAALSKPFSDWYNVNIPELTLPVVEPAVEHTQPVTEKLETTANLL